MLKASFHVLRKKSYLWRKNEFLAVSESCVILHKMLVRMIQEGLFQEDANIDGHFVNFVTELYEI